MNNTTLDVTNEEKDLGVLISNELKWSKHCQNAYTKANRVLGMINRTICSKDKIILTSLYKTLVRPHLEYCSPAWSPYYNKKLSYCWETVRRESMPRIAEMDVEMTT